MLTVLCVIIFLLGIVFTVTAFNALTAPLIKNGPSPRSHPLVSVLIPARNEEKNIADCLAGLVRQDYLHIEIIVLDDASTDATAQRVRQMAEKDARISLISSQPLPDDWIGKNWACHQLSEAAKGEILLFTDADNRHAPQAVSHTVGWMQKLGLSLLSAFPQQITRTLGEKLVLSSVYMTVYSYLPLWLTYYTDYPSLAAANGQWLAFSRNAYDKLGGHAAVRKQAVEDTALSRLAKKQGMKILTTSGQGEVFGKMYSCWPEVWEGFSKNLYGLMGYRAIPFIMLLAFMFCCYVIPYLLLFFPSVFAAAAVAVVMNMAIRSILWLKYKDSALVILLQPAAILLTMLIGINSIRVYKKKRLNWKGRNIY